MRSKAELMRILAGLMLFSIAFAYVEAAVVVYLRAMYLPLRTHFYSGAAVDNIFPLLSLDQLRALGPENIARLNIERAREFATLIMLAGVAIPAARNALQWVAGFLLCFGLWDIAFYAFLRPLLDWPASLLDWDILFLLPVPWVGPVLAPLVVSVSMVAAAAILLWREYTSGPVQISRLRWAIILSGALIILAAFMWDYRDTVNGGTPNTFHWTLFLLGEGVGLAAFAPVVSGAGGRFTN